MSCDEHGENATHNRVFHKLGEIDNINIGDFATWKQN